MDLWDVLRVLLRRWWVTAPMLLLSLAVAVLALLTVPPIYRADATIAVLPPQTRTDQRPGQATLVNPFTTETLAEFVSTSLSRPEIKRQLEASGLSADYQLTTQGIDLTVIDISVSADDSQTVAATLKRLIDMVELGFAKDQGNLTSVASITISVIDAGEKITAVHTVSKRTMIVIFLVGVLVTIAVTLAVDALIRRNGKAKGTTRFGQVLRIRPASRG